MVADKESQMAGSCREAYHTQPPPENEAGFETTGRDPAPEWQIPLRWVAASIGGLCLICLGTGLALQWLLR